MSLSLMVSTVDQRIVWVSDTFAEFLYVPSDELVGRPISDLLGGARKEAWDALFAGPGSSDERFHGFGLFLVGEVESAPRIELRGARYLDGGRTVMLSLRMAPTPAEWDSSEAFIDDVRAAMVANDIYVAYQPIVDIRTGRLRKVEALARWTHRDLGVIGPDVFIPWAERTGVIGELGEWILDQSCRDVILMADAGIDIDLSVNVSVEQLRHVDVARRFGDVIAAAGLHPERVWIEVTESVLLDADALSLLNSVHALGVRLVIDDFGTGHANFDYLTRLVVDALKIDTSFIAGLGTESRATAIVRSVIGLGRELGLEIVAEGIENDSQRAQLLDLNCRHGQGWLFSPALRRTELVATYGAGKNASAPALVAGSPSAEESVRLSALRACRILDTDEEPVFDSLVHLASQLLSAPIALISLIDSDRQWIKARFGTDLDEVQRSSWFDSFMGDNPEEQLIVADTRKSERGEPDPFVRAIPDARSYACMPFRSREGLCLGTFSVIDTRLRDFSARELNQLTMLAEQVSGLLDLRRRAVELDDLYVGARHPRRQAGDVHPNGDASALGGDALAQLTQFAGHRAAGPHDSANTLRFDGLVLDLQGRTITVDGRTLEPPAREFDLLAFLAARPGLVFTRAELLQQVWNSQPEWQNLATVTEHMHRLRAKIETNPTRPKFLRTVRGKGYSFAAAEPQDTSKEVTARSGTWVQIDASVVAADHGMVALLAARSPDDLIGRVVDDFVAPSSRSAVHAGREMRAAGSVLGPQLITLQAMDGSERLCLITTDVGEFDGAPAVIGSAREIVDAPRLMRQMVSGVVAEVSDAVIVTDSELRVISWNPAAARLYGWSEQEVLGHTLQTVVGDHTEDPGSTPWDQLHMVGGWAGASRQRSRDGSSFTVASSINVLQDSAAIAGFAVVNRLMPPGLVAADASGNLRRHTGELSDLIDVEVAEVAADELWRVSLGEQANPASGGANGTGPRRKALTRITDEVDPEASMMRLAAARSLLRAEAVEEAVGVVIGLVRDLGGSTIPARLDDRDALPLDCSFGHGEPLLARPDSVLARLRIERILPEVLEDAREAIGRLRQRDDFAELSTTDSLTGLLNRRALDQLLTRLRPNDAVIAFDIDHFKSVNDRWGHPVGDELLITFARALRSHSRPEDQFGRWGGDELTAVLIGSDEDGVGAFLKRLQETWLAVRPRDVTYSAGAALVGARSGTEALAAADAALYRAKALGRNQIAFDATQASNIGRHRTMERV